MLKRFLEGLVAFAGVAAFTMALPGLMVWAHLHHSLVGIDHDAVDYIWWFSIPLLPPCVVLWFIFVHRMLTGRRSNRIVQFLLFVATIAVEVTLLRRGIWI